MNARIDPDRLGGQTQRPTFADEVRGQTALPVDMTLAKLMRDVYDYDRNGQQEGVGQWKPLGEDELRRNGIDPRGKAFVARGANINGPAYYFRNDPIDNPGPLGMSSLDMISNCWKFNIVRVNTFASSMLLYPEDFDRTVKAFTERGIVVMIEPHDYSGRYPNAEAEIKVLIGAHKTLAGRYKDNPYDTQIYYGDPTDEAWRRIFGAYATVTDGEYSFRAMLMKFKNDQSTRKPDGTTVIHLDGYSTTIAGHFSTLYFARSPGS